MYYLIAVAMDEGRAYPRICSVHNYYEDAEQALKDAAKQENDGEELSEATVEALELDGFIHFSDGGCLSIVHFG